MAGSFKTPCPSCEADVLVKGPNLIGRKIDCPKCKYRFTVPDPKGEPEDDLDAEVKPKKKKNSQAMVGIALGVVAAAVLIGGGIYLFGGDAEKPVVNKDPNANVQPVTPKVEEPKVPEQDPKPEVKKAPNAAVKGTTDPKPNDPPKLVNPNNVGSGVPLEKPKDTVAKIEPDAKPVDPSKLKDPTNLLPGQSNAVMKINFDKLRATPIYEPFFDSTMREFFRTAMAFESSDIVSTHFCLVDSTREPFVVIRTRKAVSLQALRTEMKLELGTTPINNRPYFLVKSNPFIQALSRVVSAESLWGEAGVPVSEQEKKRWSEGQMALHYYDSQTLMIGDLAVMQRYLGELEANGEPPHQTKATAPAAAVPESGAPAAGEGGRGGKAPEAQPAPADGEAKPALARPNYLSLLPELKSMFNRLESDDAKPATIVYVDRVNQRTFAFQDRDFNTNDIMGLIFKQFLPNVDVVGVSIQQLNKEKFAAVLLFKYLSEIDMKESLEKSVGPFLFSVKGFLSYFFGTKIEISGAEAGSNAGAATTTPPGAGALDDFSTNSKIAVTSNDLTTAVDLDIFVSGDRYRSAILPQLLDAVTQMKGRMRVLSGDTTPYAVSSKYTKALNTEGDFPTGTLVRDSNPGRFGLDFPPDLRASFIVELLPYMGHANIRSGIKEKTHPWFAKENMKAATTWVPELLVPYYPQTSWRAFHPLADGGNAALGATNYVAVSGLGRDSARFDPANPAQAKLVGITGYNWGSKSSEITDGLANTIYMIQVPPTHNRPWIAGGGATIMGVETDGDPLADFVNNKEAGKRGTYALMADGSVRYLPETTDKTLFKSMVTRAGGEKIDDLNDKLPIVKPPKGQEPPELKGAGSSVKKPAKPAANTIDADELKLLQGKWKVTYAKIGGKALTTAEIDALELTVEFDDVKMIARGKGIPEQDGTILMLDPKASPKRMITQEGGKEAEPGIYELVDNNDKLKMCGRAKPTNSEDYPKSIVATDKDEYLELTRIKE